jgi:trk system potassium uptake protein TrkH
MGIHYRIVARAVGAASALTGIAMLPALATSLFFREYREAVGFAVCAAATLLLAGALFLAARTRAAAKPEHGPRAGMLIVTLWWITSSVLSALPYMACGLAGPADALFESTSGFTTTGATILGESSALPRGIVLWRSVTAWTGGIEILAVSLAMLPLAGAGYALAQVESSAGLSDRLPARERGAAIRLFAGYAGATLLLFLLLGLTSVRPFDALILALGAVSTSGFSNAAGGAASISGAAAFPLCAFMLAAASDFTLYRRISARRTKLLLRDEELRFFLLIFCCAAVAMGARLLFASPPDGAARSIGNAFFEAASALTTTGFHRADLSAWPSFCKLILLFLMLTGGCVASTASGVKVGRLVILFRLLRRNISVRLHPNAVLPVKFDGKAVPADTVNAIASYAMLCIAVFFIATAVVSLDGAGESSASVFGVLACMSNAGPCIAAASSAVAWAAYSGPTKLFLSFLMLLGRLEFTTVLLLFTPRYWKNE